MDQDIPSESQDDGVLVQLSDSEMVTFNVMCRLCANPNERIIGIYSEEGISNDLASKMNLYLPVKVSESDTLPLQCCWSCASTVLAWHELVVASVEADRRLRGLEVSNKEVDINEEFSTINDANSPGIDNNESELKSPAASLSVFCQEPAATTVVQQKRIIRLVSKDEPPPPYNLPDSFNEVKKEEWVHCDLTPDSLEKYIDNIQGPFIDPKLAGGALRKFKVDTIQKVGHKQKIKINEVVTEKTVNCDDEACKKEYGENDILYGERSDKITIGDCYSFSCQYCPLMFVNEDDIVHHVREEHPDKDLDFDDDDYIPSSSRKSTNSKKDRRKNTKLDRDAVNAAKVVVEGRIYYNCKICCKSLHSPYTYIWHMRIHTGERPFVCDLCGKQFRVSQGLVRHLRETHEGIKNFGCDICGRMFATRRNVEEHRRIHTNERPYICDLCGKSFKQKASLFVHNRSHTNSFPFRCNYCDQGFRTKPPLLIHITRHTGEKPYPCDVCGRRFRIKYELKRHKLIHSEEKPFSCGECGLSFRQKRFDSPLNSPLRTNEESDFNQSSTSNITNEETESHNCSVCHCKFATERFLTIHLYKRHNVGKPPKDEETNRSTCEICKATFKRRCDMLRHLKKQHIEKQPTVKRRRRVDIDYEIFCDVCKKGFTRRLDMEKHRIKQHPEVPDNKPNFQTEIKENEEMEDNLSISEENKNDTKTDISTCNICEKEFKKKADLNKHLKEDHNQIIRRIRRNKNEIIAQYFCDVCAKGFTRKFDMQKHRKTKHPNAPIPKEQPTEQQKNVQLLKRCKVSSNDDTNYYQCEICNRIFRQSYNFMRHQTVHTGIRAYFCHICGKNFRVSGGLHRHITEHHYGVKKYECDICGKSFAAKATRDDHRNIHTDARPFVCDVCGKAFRQKASLHIHKLFHSDNFRFSCNVCGKKYRRASELKIHSWLHTGHKPHQCTMCGARFRLRQDLKRHIKIHDKLSECVCNECGSTFSQERYLKNHKKTHRSKEETPFVLVQLPSIE